MTVITRFAPSPTGYLHIGGARTALFNWLFSKHHGGKFLLRIEDTDRARSTQEAVDALLKGLAWLGLDADEEPVFQFARSERHAAVARQLLAEGKAYYCYSTPEELEAMREKARLNGLPPRYNGFWRDRDPSQAPPGVLPTIRFKAPQEGSVTIHDLVQGEVTIQNSQLDDMVLLRADGTPTYMLSVVVDDHDMDITHIIRGDDHLTNAFRQYHLYQACRWHVPFFAHVPMIHGPDGSKLSKRHGALGVDAYEDMGFLPEAMRNYLLRLGWSHGNEEIISTAQAIGWFDVDMIGKSPARFDLVKLSALNGHYLREADDGRLLALIESSLEKRTGRSLHQVEKERILKGMGGLKVRAKTLLELGDAAVLYLDMLEPFSEEMRKQCEGAAAPLLEAVLTALEALSDFGEEALEACLRQTAEKKEVKMGVLAQALRVALTGKTVSPSLFEVMAILGKELTLERLSNALGS